MKRRGIMGSEFAHSELSKQETIIQNATKISTSVNLEYMKRSHIMYCVFPPMSVKWGNPKTTHYQQLWSKLRSKIKQIQALAKMLNEISSCF